MCHRYISPSQRGNPCWPQRKRYLQSLVLEDCNVINGLVPLIFASVVSSKILMLAPESINPSTGQFAMVITALGSYGNAPIPNSPSVSASEESDRLFICCAIGSPTD